MSTKTDVLNAIDAKCRDCTYDPLSTGTWQQQVRLCCSANCPLHPYRYGQPDRKGGRVLTDEQKKIAADRFAAMRRNKTEQKTVAQDQ